VSDTTCAYGNLKVATPTVSPVAVKDLAWCDVQAKAWLVEPMTYGVLVGPSARPGELLKARFTVTPGKV